MTLAEIDYRFLLPLSLTARRLKEQVDASNDVQVQCRALLGSMPPGSAFSHVTALKLLKLPIPDVLAKDQRIHVTSSQERSRSQSSRTVNHHLDAHDPGEPFIVSGLPIIRPGWAWVQECQRISDSDAVLIADGMMRRQHPLETPESLEELLGSVRNIRGVIRARNALELAEPNTDSPMETLTRLLLVLAGLPTPDVNPEIFDDSGQYVCRSDLVYWQWRVVVEYDGDVHRTDRATWQRDNEKRRHLAELGFYPIYVTADDVYKRPKEIIAHVRKALRDRGWDGHSIESAA